MTVREKLRELNVRLVEIATYLSLSRPTIYKYLEMYEAKEFSKIDKVTYDLFYYIDATDNLTKPALMNYLITHFAPQAQVHHDFEQSALIDRINRLIASDLPADRALIQGIEMLLETDPIKREIILSLIKSIQNKE